MANLTYVDAINFALDVMNIMNPDVAPNDDKFYWDEEKVKEKLEALKIQLKKREHGSKRPTAKQTENEAIKDTICEILTETDERMRVKDLLADDRLSGYSSSKISALLRQMLPEVGDGRVIKEIEKKVSYFRIAK